MSVPFEYCPKCDCRQEMVLSLGMPPTGSGEDTLLVHFHCRSCLKYVKTDRMDVVFGCGTNFVKDKVTDAAQEVLLVQEAVLSVAV